MAVHIDCDHCRKPIADVVYRIVAIAHDEPERVVSKGPDLHYNCVVPYLTDGKGTDRG